MDASLSQRMYNLACITNIFAIFIRTTPTQPEIYEVGGPFEDMSLEISREGVESWRNLQRLSVLYMSAWISIIENLPAHVLVEFFALLK